MSSLKFCLMPLSMLLLGGPPALGEAVSHTASSSSDQNALSLGQAQRMALERNWNLLAAAKGIDVALPKKLLTHKSPNPTFSFPPSKPGVDAHPNPTPAGNGLWDRS